MDRDARIRSWLATLVLAVVGSAQAAAPDYALRAQRVAPDVYVFIGPNEDFSPDNGGAILNSGFIVAPQGVIVIDTGPSRQYGEQMRTAIAAVTSRPVRQVYITHAHPDHFLGTQAFADASVAALPATRRAIDEHGGSINATLYRTLGTWMIGTTATAPTATAIEGPVTVAGRALQLIAGDGHSSADLMVYDDLSGTLFAGDLVFHQRAPTTPDADIDRWLRTLDRIDTLDIRVLVPGHGPVAVNREPVAQTRDYLHWLVQRLRGAVQRGLDIPEVLAMPVPQRYASLAVFDTEFARSVAQLYPVYETELLFGPAP